MMIWVNGRLSTEGEAQVSPFDHALLTGDGVFETLKVEGGVPFAVRRHLERLTRSAAGLAIDPPSADQIRDALDQVVAANDLSEGVARITLTGGPAPLGSDRGSVGPTLIVACGPPRGWGAEAAVAVAPWPRNERSALAGLKTVSYAENVIALRWAKERGAEEAVFGNLAGQLCEGTGTNVFVAVAGRMLTPPLNSGCLAGVTRDLLLELGVAEEADLPLSALAEADEAFLTSSTRDVHPISSVDGAPLPTVPGPLTNAAAEAFRALQARDVDP
ncbi:MAG: aminotransferase class IV family protein [Acidimicrobiia bacterium]|nr:aminotransferase class IV family protein [Acidimicrobiia bacterium]